MTIIHILVIAILAIVLIDLVSNGTRSFHLPSVLKLIVVVILVLYLMKKM